MAKSKTPESTPADPRAAEQTTTVIEHENETPATKAARSIHDGHRRRLRERLLRGGVDALAPHELLELLLGYAMPRVDVNPLAHQLINRFGSLSGVMDASAEELTAETGVGEQIACLIRLIPTISRMCAIEQAKKCQTYDTLGKLADFLRPRFTNLTEERVYLVMMDNGLRIIDCRPIADGTVNSAAVTVRRIAELCLYTHATAIVLAHNHPRGIAVPSSEDIAMTQHIESALALIGVTLIEHLIVTETAVTPILRPRRGMERLSPTTGEVDAGFYRNFYGVEK